MRRGGHSNTSIYAIHISTCMLCVFRKKLVGVLPGRILIEAKTNARIWISYKLDSRLLKSFSYFFDSLEMCADRTVQAFQSTNGRNCSASLDREPVLLPADERACGFNLACNH